MLTGIWNRINTVLLVLVLMALLGVIAMLSTSARGGSLEPPGPPAPTDAVKLPGTPISSAPYVITQPGHYYLTRNLSVNGAVIAIDIQVSDVSLDLGGFTIDGNNSSPSYGILLRATQNVEVKHGSVREFQFGIEVSAGTDVRLDDVHATLNVRGIQLGSRSTLTNCTSTDNTETGIYVPASLSTIRYCYSADNSNDGLSVAGVNNTIESSVFQNNGGVSFADARISGFNYFVRNFLQGDLIITGLSNTVANNVCNAASGDIIDNGSGNVIVGNIGC